MCRTRIRWRATLWRWISRLARRTLGWTERLVDKHMIAATAMWYQAWARGEDMRAVTLRQISDYQAL